MRPGQVQSALPAETSQGRTLVTRLSIVIPCVGPFGPLEETLASVLEHRPEDCEVLVPHTRPYANPYQLEGEVRFLHVADKRAVQLVNRALEDASGDIIHLLAPGLEVVRGWTDPALPHFADPSVAAVSPLVRPLNQPGRIETLGVTYQRGGLRQDVGAHRPLPDYHDLKDDILGPSLSAGFYSREVLEAIGGLPLQLGDELADIDLALTIRDLELRAIFEPRAQVLTTADYVPPQANSALVRGQQAELLFWRHAQHDGLALGLLHHPVAAIRDALGQGGLGRSLLHLLGRTLGLMSRGAAQVYEEQLLVASELLADQPGSHTLSLEAARREAAASAGARQIAPTSQKRAA